MHVQYAFFVNMFLLEELVHENASKNSLICCMNPVSKDISPRLYHHIHISFYLFSR